MIKFLIGHRGVGKTSLLDRIKRYYKEESKAVQCIDLDQEIENRQGRSIPDIFESEGEEYFREMERFQLREIATMFASYEGDVFVALGAGFTPDDSVTTLGQFIWVRRETDKSGRIFLNRPRLNPEASPLDEYTERFEVREKLYRSLANETVTLKEGLDKANVFEKELFFPVSDLRATITLLPGHRTKWNIEYELRDDLLSAAQLEEALRADSLRADQPRRLLSFRSNPPSEVMLNAVVKNARVDWPVELPASMKLNPTFISLHAGSLSEAKLQLKTKSPIKLAVKIRSWSELLEGHTWWTENKIERSFLPMSDDGRWNWYRLWIGSQSLVNFVREGEGSAADQPTILDWLSTHANDPEFRQNGFAAVLGDPVIHSRTPSEQQEFFANYKMPVFSIRVTKDEWPEALPVLRDLGLKAAAVTAPLKELAFLTCNETSDLARTFESVNTLLFKDGKWIGENTDLGGFQALKVNRKESAVIWGGGGTLEITRLMVPQASLYSAQTGQVREGAKPFPPAGSPTNLVWSVGRAHYGVGTNKATAKWPPSHWKPRRVIDLNYTDDSPGLEYAALTGAEYVSGLSMFKEQARLQREFWRVHLPHGR